MKKFVSLIITITILLSAGCSIPAALDEMLTGDETAQDTPSNLDTARQETNATATPTVAPEVRLESADDYLFAGDLENALMEYTTAFTQSQDRELKAIALYGAGRVYLTQRDYPAAIDAFTHILGQYADTEIVANTYFLLATSYAEQEEYQQAANAYAQFQALKPGIMDAYVLQLQANAASLAGDHYSAIYALQNASQSDPAPDAADINLQIGQEYEALEDLNTAIQYYLSAHELATTDYQHATADLLAGQAYLELGLTDQAYTRFLDAVMNYPMAYDSFTSLSILVSAGYPVDEYMRGIVD